MAPKSVIEFFGVPPIKYIYDGGDMYFSSSYANDVLFIATTTQGIANIDVAKLLRELFGKVMDEHPEHKRVVVFHDWSRINEIKNLAEILNILYRVVDQIGNKHGEVVVFASMKERAVIHASIKAAFHLLGKHYYLEETREGFLKKCELIQLKYSNGH